MRNMAVVFLQLSLLWLTVGQVEAAPIVLKEYSGAGYTFTNVADTLISGYSPGETGYNHGGVAAPSNVYSGSRVLLVRFDLGAVPDLNQVATVNSATLRLYRSANIYGNGNFYAGQLAQGWVEGTSSGFWDGACDGAQWYTRNGGTITPKASLVSDGAGIWYIPDVTSLADDPLYAGKRFVRNGNPPGNYNNVLNNYTQYDTLIDLQNAGATRGYFWDSAASRLYVNKNDWDVRWYAAPDMWATPGAGITGSYITDTSASGPSVPGWIEFDITSFVNDWVISGQDNNGVRVYGAGQNTVVLSEYTDDPTLRPELVLDLTYVPEPATLGLLLLTVGGLMRRRSA